MLPFRRPRGIHTAPFSELASPTNLLVPLGLPLQARITGWIHRIPACGGLAARSSLLWRPRGSAALGPAGLGLLGVLGLSE
jgi:hypothetical protein